MNADIDPTLSAWFEGLQEQDHAFSPPFESMLAKTPTRHPRTGSGRGWATGGVAVAASVVLFLVVQRPALAPVADVNTLPAWRSPTDFLLASPDDSLARLGWTQGPTTVLGAPSIQRAPRG